MKKFILRALAAVAAAGACICVFALAADPAPGSSSDPLVSLSYINDVLKPEMESYVDSRVLSEAEILKAELNEKINYFIGAQGDPVFVSPR
ncbi:MAG: hypothetical protein IKE62_01490 [Oscillospiraceae bacterium]|nr:hypothetical protein [Oscillospiraceae bacterium]